MTVTVGDEQWYDDLGWSLPMIHRLDALRTEGRQTMAKEIDGIRHDHAAELRYSSGLMSRQGSAREFANVTVF